MAGAANALSSLTCNTGYWAYYLSGSTVANSYCIACPTGYSICAPASGLLTPISSTTFAC